MNRVATQIILFVAIAIAIVGCDVSQSARSSAAITSEECTSDKSFAFVTAGDFILGSDRQERDYAYRISAESIADTEAEIKQAKRKLRKIGWFDGESDRQTLSLPGFCISRNLVTNQDYLEFIQATKYRTPDIKEAEYQKQGFLVHPYSEMKEFLWTNNTYPKNQ